MGGACSELSNRVRSNYMVWALVIAAIVHLFAYLLYKIGVAVLEFGNHFLYGVGAFFVVFAVAAIGIKLLLPNPGPANIASVPNAILSTAYAAQ